MKKVWRYKGKRYVIYDDMAGNYFLNGHPYHCMDILLQLDCQDKSVVRLAKDRAKEIVDKIGSKNKIRNRLTTSATKKSNKIGISKVVFLGAEEKRRISMYLFAFESKEWKYEGKQYIIHYDVKNDRIYLNGNLVYNCFDIWLNIDSPNDTISWRMKHKAKEIEIARLEASGIKIDRCELPEHPSSILENVGNGLVVALGIAFVIGIFYLIYQIWWFFIGDWAFNGPFAFDTSAEDIILETILFFIALIVIVEEVVRRIRNGHF